MALDTYAPGFATINPPTWTGANTLTDEHQAPYSGANSEVAHREAPYNPVHALWCRVITMALRDAVSNGATKRKDRREAREWLTTYSRGLNEVCQFAGIDPDAVLRLGRRLAAQGWPSDEIMQTLDGAETLGEGDQPARRRR